MCADSSETLRTELKQAYNRIKLIERLDDIRDQTPEPSQMLAGIVDTLVDQFEGDFGLIALHDRESGQLELKAINDRTSLLSDADPRLLRGLAEVASQLDTVEMWTGLPDGVSIDDAGLLEGVATAGVPIVMGPRERLGALILGRRNPVFSAEEIDMLKAAESQIDSAVIQGYAYNDLQQRNRELEVIYNVDRIRDQQLPFNQMLNGVLQELRGAIPAEVGFIMLYNNAGGTLEMRAVTRNDLFRTAAYSNRVQEIANEALEATELVCYNDLDTGDLKSVLCIPLILRDEILGVFGLVNGYEPGGFTEQDRRLLIAIASQMDTAIFESLEQRRMRRLLGRSVGPSVMERLLRNPDVDFLKGERAVISVLYADLRGSTELAQRTDPELLVGFINEYLSEMGNIVLRYDGTLDKYVGDEVMALFGAPFPQPDHALRSVRVGLEMVAEHLDIIKRWQPRGVTPAPVGVGIATGELIHGEFGSEMRTDYTVIGQAANLGSRICGAALADQVLIDQGTYDMVKDQVEVEALPPMHLKGIDGAVPVYWVKGLR